jgi:TolB-like protein
MALSAGDRLGPYEILAPLGAGGMGEVYRARDPRLKRDVALKVLPADLASEPERLERFEREAQTVAALNPLALAVGYQQTRSPSEPPPPESSPTERKMLVVLPFENLGAPEDAYFADGMTEEITSRLARVSGLGVISRTSAVQYDRTGKTMKQVGEDLGVGFVLEGTVRWDRQGQGAERVRITTQLIRVADDTHLWAESYDRVLEDFFAAQSEIAQAVVEQLGVTLLPEEQKGVAARPTENMEAYQAYLRGQKYLSDPSYDREPLELARQMFQRAVELDPGFAAAHAGLAATNVVLYDSGFDPTPKRLTEAQRAARRALELDPNCFEGHLATSLYHRARNELDRAIEELRAAARLRPSDAAVALEAGRIRARQGRFDEAIAEFEKAVRLDPLRTWAWNSLVRVSRALRRYPEAIRYADHAIAAAPDQAGPYLVKAAVYWEWGRLPEARATLKSAPQQDDPQYLYHWFYQELFERNYEAALRQHARMSLAEAWAALGRGAEAIREAKRIEDQHPVSADAWATEWVWHAALVCTRAGDHEGAINRLEYLLSIPSYVSVSGRLQVQPELVALRDDPSFRKLLANGKREIPSR